MGTEYKHRNNDTGNGNSILVNVTAKPHLREMHTMEDTKNGADQKAANHRRKLAEE